MLNVKRKTLGKCFRMLRSSLERKVPTTDPFEYTMRLANMINDSEKVKRLAMNILNDIVVKEIPGGKILMAVATSVICICGKKSGHHTQHNFAKAAGITEITLRNRFMELEKKVLYFN